MSVWNTSSNQTIWDLAIQLYGDVSFAYKVLQDNNLDWTYQASTNDEIEYNVENLQTSLQQQLLQNRVVIATGFVSQGGIPPFIQRSYNNDFSLDFD